MKFLFIARGSAGEVRSLLYVALDQDYITQREFDAAKEACVQAARLIWGLIRSLSTKAGWITGLRICFLELALHLGVSTR